MFDLLVERYDCVFIYVVTICRFVGDRYWRPQEQLSLILRGTAIGHQPTVELDHMHMQILKHSVAQTSEARHKARLSERFEHFVGSIVTRFDVLSAAALAYLLNLPEAHYRATTLCAQYLRKPQRTYSPSSSLLSRVSCQWRKMSRQVLLD